MAEYNNGNIIPDLIPGTPVGISIYSVTKEAPHHHEGFMEIIYCFKGPVRINSRSQDIFLEDGDVISCDPFDIHYMTAADSPAPCGAAGTASDDNSSARSSTQPPENFSIDDMNTQSPENRSASDTSMQPPENHSDDNSNSYRLHSAEKASGSNLLVSFYFDLHSPVFEKPDLDKLYFMCEPSAIPESKQPELQELKRLLLTLLYFYCFPHPKLPRAETAVRFAKKIIQAMLDHFHYFYFIANSTDYSDDMKALFDSITIYIEKNYKDKISLGGVCELNHYNYKYISRFFKKTSEVGFSKFVSDIRAYKAAALLLESDKNISDVSYEVGFSAPLYFYKVVKMWNGMTPHQYRKKLRNLTAASEENIFYDIPAVKEDLEHFISFYFAQLQVPELWLMPYIPFKGLPI